MDAIRDFFLYTRCLGRLRHAPRPLCVGLETRNQPSYGQRGVDRKDAPHAIFQYTLSGTGCFVDASGSYEVRPGTGFLCESHDRAVSYHYPNGATEPWRFVFLDFSGRTSLILTRDLVRNYGPVYQLPVRHPVIERLLDLRAHDMFGCILSQAEGTDIVIDLLMALAAGSEGTPAQLPAQQMVRNVHAFVQANMDRMLGVGDIAANLNLSREHLTRIFKQQAGIGPYQYILANKIEAACILFRSTDLSVKETAARLGFDNTASFSRAFKRLVRCTPGDYRCNFLKGQAAPVNHAVIP